MLLQWGVMDGAIVVNKPAGWTSHDAVAKVRRLANTRRVGHLGTLDPMATGVLPLVVGVATRLAQFYVRSDKVYDAVIRFGHSTDTYDRDGVATSPAVETQVTKEQIEPLLDRFRGTIQQTPPPVSAKKVAGVPAYRLARKHVEVELKPVEVTIHSLDLVECSGSDIRILVHCSAGTYLRALAHDLGKLLGCGAFLDRLIRTRAGDFSIEQARTIEQLEGLLAEDRFIEAFMWRTIFSSITMASSTTNPIDRINAIMEMLFMLKFSRYITEKVPTTENGSAIAGIMVAEKFRRKRKITRMTRASVAAMVN